MGQRLKHKSKAISNKTSKLLAIKAKTDKIDCIRIRPSVYLEIA